jgi:hypothetical protein
VDAVSILAVSPGGFRDDARNVNTAEALVFETENAQLVVEGDLRELLAEVREAVDPEHLRAPDVVSEAVEELLDTLQGQTDSLGYMQHLTYREAAALAGLARASGLVVLAAQLMLSWACGDEDAWEWGSELRGWGVMFEQHNDGEGQWVFTDAMAALADNGGVPL